MDQIALALEEYKTLRQESLMALERQHNILRFGIGLVGVLLGLGVQLESETVLATVLLVFFVPTLMVFTVILWMAEVERMVRAGAYIADLEGRINEAAGAGVVALAWETHLRQEGEASTPRLRSAYHAIFLIFLLLVFASVVIGFYNAVKDEWTPLLIPVAFVDVLLLSWLTSWYVVNVRRVRARGSDPPPNKHVST